MVVFVYIVCFTNNFDWENFFHIFGLLFDERNKIVIQLFAKFKTCLLVFSNLHLLFPSFCRAIMARCYCWRFVSLLLSDTSIYRWQRCTGLHLVLLPSLYAPPCFSQALKIKLTAFFSVFSIDLWNQIMNEKFKNKYNIPIFHTSRVKEQRNNSMQTLSLLYNN